jgi:hypothetical protein
LVDRQSPSTLEPTLRTSAAFVTLRSRTFAPERNAAVAPRGCPIDSSFRAQFGDRDTLRRSVAFYDASSSNFLMAQIA